MMSDENEYNDNYFVYGRHGYGGAKTFLLWSYTACKVCSGVQRLMGNGKFLQFTALLLPYRSKACGYSWR